MKTTRILSTILAITLTCQPSSAEVREWTHAASKKTLRGAIVSKKSDNSEVTIKKENTNNVHTLKTKELSEAD